MYNKRELYYTPEIEEFHIGFEYEWINTNEDDIWRPTIADLEDCYHACNNLNNNIEYLKYRVKYLDEEDIESLGWKYYKKGWKDNSKVYRLNISIGYELYYRGAGSCHITTSNGSILFEGNIKNKSELKKVLKMLNIST